MSGCELGPEAAFAFIEVCESLERSEQIQIAFQRAIERLGFKSYIISGLPGPSESPDPFVLLNTWPIEWYQRYVRNRYFEQDPVGLIAARIPKPFAWKDMPRDADTLDWSRIFVVPSRRVPRKTRNVRGALVTAVVDYALSVGAREVGGVMETFLLPYGQSLGLKMRVLGLPQEIAGSMTLAAFVQVDQAALASVRATTGWTEPLLRFKPDQPRRVA